MTGAKHMRRTIRCLAISTIATMAVAQTPSNPPSQPSSDRTSDPLDACAELSAPLIEVHISNVFAREEFRHHSYLSPVATGVIVGCGVQGYALALRYLAGR